MSSHSVKKILNSRLGITFFLGLSSGLPLALTNSTLQAWFSQAHVNVVMIGALSLLGLPYTIKFLWAPLMDHYSFPFLGKRRGWIILMQICLALTLLVLAQMNPSTQIQLMAMIALMVAFFSASQDIAIDAYRTDVLLPEERGLGASYYVFAYRLALLFAGGFALIMADSLGWKFTYSCMALIIFLSIFATLKAPVVSELKVQEGLYETIKLAINDLLKREKIVLIILFILFYKFGDALALSLVTHFLLDGLGFTLTEVGLANKMMSFIATILGGFVGGLILLRWNIYRALLIFGCAQAVSNLAFAGLAWVGKDFLLMASAVFLENFCSGLSTAAFLAFLMLLCNHQYTATQYALFAALFSVGRVFLGPVAGYMLTQMSWTQFYCWSFVLCFPGIFLLISLKEKVLEYVPVPAD